MKTGILALCVLNGLAYGAAAQVVEADSRLDDGRPYASAELVRGGELARAFGVGYSSLLRVGENVLYDAVAETNLWRAIDSHPGAFCE